MTTAALRRMPRRVYTQNAAQSCAGHVSLTSVAAKQPDFSMMIANFILLCGVIVGLIAAAALDQISPGWSFVYIVLASIAGAGLVYAEK